MIILCGDSIITPLRIIFENIISTRIFPDGWKIANVVPVHKKESKDVHAYFFITDMCEDLRKKRCLNIFTTIFK